jgi:iron-sulfur cluster assembly protein
MDVLETVKSAPVKFSKDALAELQRLQETLDLEDGQFLRIGVKGGGCSGMSYVLAFDNQEESDLHYEIDGIKVVMNKSHVMYVIGMEVEWENGLNNRGFAFVNPNAKTTCGCGQSFSS